MQPSFRLRDYRFAMLLAFLILLPSSLFAQFTTTGTRSSLTIEPSPLAVGATSITQNTDPNTITDGISCGGAENHIARAYQLSAYPQLDEAKVRIDSVQFGVARADQAQTIRVKLHTSTTIPPTIGSLTEIATVDVAVPIIPSGSPAFFTATFPTPPILNVATDILVVETITFDTFTSFVATNEAGHSAPSYIYAVACGINDFITLADVGFPTHGWVQTVNVSKLMPAVLYVTLPTPATGITADAASGDLYVADQSTLGFLRRVPAGGGAPVTVTSDFSTVTGGDFYPFVATDIEYLDGAVYVTQIDSLTKIDVATGTSSVLTLVPGSNVEAALASAPGLLFGTTGFGSPNSIFDFNLSSLVLTPLVTSGVPALSGLEYDRFRDKLYAADSGTAYLVDRVGGTLATVGTVANHYGNHAISPDGDYLFFVNGTSVMRMRVSDGNVVTYAAGLPGGAFPDITAARSSSGSGWSLYVTQNAAIYEIPGFSTPSATDEAYSTLDSTALVVGAPGVLANDSDPESQPLSATLWTAPKYGALVLNPDGSFDYTPNPGFLGTDYFEYAAGDGTTHDMARVTIDVVHPPIVANDDSYDVGNDGPTTIAAPGVLGNDVPVPGFPMTATLVSGPSNGFVLLHPDGSFTYVPGATGPDSFQYQASDGVVSDIATVTINVLPSPLIESIVPDNGNAGGGYTININGNDFASGDLATIGGFPIGAPMYAPSLITGSVPALTPGTLNDVMVDGPNGGYVLPKAFFSDFTDVQQAPGIHDFVESIFRFGITAGCGSGNYCPANKINRAQMAVFLLVARHGKNYTPPPATGTVFADVPIGSFAAAWIEQLAAEGITGGCGGGNYCPTSPVTRAQMAVFLLVAFEGTGYTPPPATGTMFNDVPASNGFAKWIEELANRGITAGCGGGNYCPSNSVTRGQMAVFLKTTFGFGTSLFTDFTGLNGVPVESFAIPGMTFSSGGTWAGAMSSGFYYAQAEIMATSVPGASVSVTFAQGMSAADFSYLFLGGGRTLLVEAYLDGVLVGSVLYEPIIQWGGAEEGFGHFETGLFFNELRFIDDGNGFTAIDNLSVSSRPWNSTGSPARPMRTSPRNGGEKPSVTGWQLP